MSSAALAKEEGFASSGVMQTAFRLSRLIGLSCSGRAGKNQSFFDKMLDKHMIVCYFLKRGGIIDISGVLDGWQLRMMRCVMRPIPLKSVENFVVYQGVKC